MTVFEHAIAKSIQGRSALRQDDRLFFLENVKSTLEPWNPQGSESFALVRINVVTGNVEQRTSLPRSFVTTQVADGTTFDFLLGPVDDPVTIHESGTEPHMKSHWNTYKTFLTHDDKNVLAAAERVVGATADFLNRVITALQENNCMPHGRINFFPYQPPPQP